MIWFILNLKILEAIIAFILLFLTFLTIRFYLEKIQIADWRNKAVYITGCDSGFGKGLTLRCLQHGMPVFAGCLTQKGIDNLIEESKSFSGKLDAFILDVSSDQSVTDVANQLERKLEKYGGLHALVNNAGITSRSVYDDFLDISEYTHVANVNLWGVIRTTQSMKNQLKIARGRIITVASICARVALPSLGPYTVSKYGVSGYCDVIRQELRPFGISVHILEPGFFNTPLVNRAKIENEINEGWSRANEHVRHAYGEEFFRQSKSKSLQLLDLVSSDRVDLVIDAYFHAITARFPRSRYQVGWDSILLFIPFSFLPTRVQDAVFAMSSLFMPKPASILR